MHHETLDKTKIDDFWQGRTQVADPRIATNYRDDGRLELDFRLAKSYSTPQSRVLDLGAGSCTLSGRLEPHVASVLAVDKYAGFLKHAPRSAKFSTECADVVEFRSQGEFDLILLFGVVNFLNIDDERELYERCQAMLSASGTFIVKNQCGLEGEHIVDKHSTELDAHYHARYPDHHSQRELLAKHFDVSVVDIYPPEINRWNDTHFYAFVCRHKSQSA